MDPNSSLPKRSNDKKLPTTYGLPKFRERVINLLENAYVGNELDTHDYEKRLDLVHAAQSVEELKLAIHDFPQKEAIFPSPTHASRKSPARSQQLPSPVQGFLKSFEEADAMTIIGDCHLSSTDITKPNAKVFRGIGDTVIDLRDIGHKFEHVRIESYSLIGDVRVLVPVNAKVKRKMFILIGEKTQRVRSKAQSFFDKIFGTNTRKVFKKQTSSSSEVSIEIAGFNLIGNLVVEYYQDEDEL